MVTQFGALGPGPQGNSRDEGRRGLVGPTVLAGLAARTPGILTPLPQAGLLTQSMACTRFQGLHLLRQEAMCLETAQGKRKKLMIALPELLKGNQGTVQKPWVQIPNPHRLAAT
jgi:hypothetical protein